MSHSWDVRQLHRTHRGAPICSSASRRHQPCRQIPHNRRPVRAEWRELRVGWGKDNRCCHAASRGLALVIPCYAVFSGSSCRRLLFYRLYIFPAEKKHPKLPKPPQTPTLRRRYSLLEVPGPPKTRELCARASLLDARPGGVMDSHPGPAGCEASKPEPYRGQLGIDAASRHGLISPTLAGGNEVHFLTKKGCPKCHVLTRMFRRSFRGSI